MLLLLLACAEECEPARISGPTGTDASVRVCDCEAECYAASGFDASGAFESGRLEPGCYVVVMEWVEEAEEQRCAMEWASQPIEVGCGEDRVLEWGDGESTSVCGAL